MSNRRTAFARVPRGPVRNTQPRTDLVRIDANFLERLERANMSPDLSTIMTKTASKLEISIGAQASAEYSLVNKNGVVVADKADIKRIQTMSSSITKERKSALGEEVGIITKFTLAAFVQKSLEWDAVTSITAFHKGFVPVYRSVNTQYQTIVKNLNTIASIDAAGAGGKETVKNIFAEMGRRISIAVGRYLVHRATLAEETTPSKLNSFLFEAVVPIWIFNKLSASVIATSAQGFDIRHILFPKDPSKGVSLTFKEIRSATFRNNVFGLCGGSQLVIRMAMDDSLIRLMINLPDTVPVDNFDEANSVAAKMANTPFYLLPFDGAVEVADRLNFLSKNGVRGIQWVSGTVLTPVDLLKFYGTIGKRMDYLLLTRPQFKAALIQGAFPGFVFDPVNEQQDIFVQLKSFALRQGSDVGFFRRIESNIINVDFKRFANKLFRDVSMVADDHAISAAFRLMMNGEEIPIHQGTSTDGPLFFTEVKNHAVSLRERQLDPDQIIAGRLATSLVTVKKKEPANRAGIQERSRLTDVAKTALLELRTRGYAALSARMQTWFRLFLDETVQDAVAGIFLARLESFLEAPLEVSREERHGFMEPDDPEDNYVEPEDEDEVADPVPVNADEA